MPASKSHHDGGWRSEKRLAMNGRIQISLDPEIRRRAKARAEKLKISLAEYLRRLIAQDLSVSKRKLDISAVFDLADSGPATNIAREGQDDCEGG